MKFIIHDFRARKVSAWMPSVKIWINLTRHREQCQIRYKIDFRYSGTEAVTFIRWLRTPAKDEKVTRGKVLRRFWRCHARLRAKLSLGALRMSWGVRWKLNRGGKCHYKTLSISLVFFPKAESPNCRDTFARRGASGTVTSQRFNWISYLGAQKNFSSRNMKLKFYHEFWGFRSEWKFH